MSNSEKPAPETEAALTAFDTHKHALLTILREACERGPQTTQFDPDGSWSYLRRLAVEYFKNEAERKRAMPPANCLARLEKLENAFGQARRLASKAMQDDIGDRLFWAWFVPCGPVDDPYGPEVPARNEFDKLIEALAALETAAFRASERVRNRRGGRPRGILQPNFIFDLESAYRGITAKPGGTGSGPFARFVKEVVDALGGRAIAMQTVIRAIKAAKSHDRPWRSWGRSLPRTWGKTPPNSL
jgi:hypothetical protein